MSNKDFLEFLKDGELLEYGSVIPVTLVHKALNIRMSTVMNIKKYEVLKLQEVAAIDYIRVHLLDEGKVLTKKGDRYVIPMPSENRTYVERYIRSADKKLRRSIKLSMNTPPGDYKSLDTSLAEAVRKRQTLADVKRKGDLLK